MSGFQHDIAGGDGNLVITSVQSPDFVHGVSGWQISRNGNAEFNNVQARGQFFLAGANGSEIAIILSGNAPIIELVPQSVTHMTVSPEIFSVSTNPGTAAETMFTTVTSGKSGNDDAALQLFSEAANASTAAEAILEFGGFVAFTLTRAALSIAGAVQPGNGSGVGTGANIYSGTGAPTLSGTAGDLFIRKDGGSGSYLYRCTGGTSWTAFA